MEDKVYFGKVIWFNAKRGFGFIEWTDNGVAQTDMFIHFSDIICDGFKTVSPNQKISFKIGKNNKNAPKAIEIKLL